MTYRVTTYSRTEGSHAITHMMPDLEAHDEVGRRIARIRKVRERVPGSTIRVRDQAQPNLHNEKGAHDGRDRPTERNGGPVEALRDAVCPL
jgi:hypothetical protein